MKPIMYKVFENHLMSHYLRFIQYANFKIIIFFYEDCMLFTKSKIKKEIKL